MSFLNLELLKGKPTKFLRIIFCLKFKKYDFGIKKLKKKQNETKIVTYMNL
jgi:hypothetical protein